jgi:hypothetical protein
LAELVAQVVVLRVLQVAQVVVLRVALFWMHVVDRVALEAPQLQLQVAQVERQAVFS